MVQSLTKWCGKHRKVNILIHVMTWLLTQDLKNSADFTCFSCCPNVNPMLHPVEIQGLAYLEAMYYFNNNNSNLLGYLVKNKVPKTFLKWSQVLSEYISSSPYFFYLFLFIFKDVLPDCHVKNSTAECSSVDIESSPTAPGLPKAFHSFFDSFLLLFIFFWFLL